MIQCYFGNGKGKTSAAVGSAIRCAGCGGRVLFVQFLKNNESSECEILNSIDLIDVICSKETYKLYDNLNRERAKVFQTAYRKLLFDQVSQSAPSYQMIILDEILDAVQFGFIKEEELLEFLNQLKNQSELILTGHTMTEKLTCISDYISEIKEICHPYQKGVLPRKGIEY